MTATNTAPTRAGYARMVDALESLGIGEMFGVMGVGNLYMIGEYVRRGGRYVAARHEAGAVNMADGIARSTGGLGVATVIQGPGLTNALTALVTAVRSASPVLVITSELPLSRRPTGQAIEQEPFLTATGAAYVRVTDTDPGAALAEAAGQALRECRPVVVSFPGPVQERMWQVGPLTLPETTHEPVPVAEADVDGLLEQFASATHPVVLAGRGVDRAGAGDLVAELAERTGALLGTTALMKDRYRGHHADIGIVGGLSHVLTRDLLAGADLVVGFGAALSVWTIARGGLFPTATLVQVDHDPQALGAQARIDRGVVGDVRVVAEALLDRLPAASAAPARWDTEKAFDRLAAWQPDDGFTDTSTAEQLDPRTASLVLDRQLPRDRLLTLDSGHHIGFPAEYVRVTEPRRFQFTASYGAIGQALGVAIGAAVGTVGPAHVCVLGDGGLATSIADLETVGRERIPLLVVVLDDQAYGAEIHHLRHEGLPDEIARFDGPDVVRIATGFGCAAVRVRTADELAAAVRGWPGNGPLVIDVMIDGMLLSNWYAEVLDPPR